MYILTTLEFPTHNFNFHHIYIYIWRWLTNRYTSWPSLCHLSPGSSMVRASHRGLGDGPPWNVLKSIPFKRLKTSLNLFLLFIPKSNKTLLKMLKYYQLLIHNKVLILSKSGSLRSTNSLVIRQLYLVCPHCAYGVQSDCLNFFIVMCLRSHAEVPPPPLPAPSPLSAVHEVAL